MGSSVEDLLWRSGIDSDMDSDLDLMMMDSGVNSGSDLLWRILGLILLWVLIRI